MIINNINNKNFLFLNPEKINRKECKGFSQRTQKNTSFTVSAIADFQPNKNVSGVPPSKE
jgi:hypothetical protein